MLNIAQGAWFYTLKKENGKDILCIGNKYKDKYDAWGMIEGEFEREAVLITAAPQMYTLLSLIAEDPSIQCKYKADVQELVHLLEGKINNIF
ncbi:MAG: hypothetical protein IJT21_07660 [Synergistaceae bacterium]|nr:hypothetical protein [Synergistaceae bacterium]